MPRGRRSRNKKSKDDREKPANVIVQGPWGTSLSVPIARLPFTLGSDRRLTSATSVYPTVLLDVPLIVTRYAVAAGATTTVYSVDISKISNFSTRFGALFDEYCIVGARFEVRMNNVVNPQGFLVAYLDEKSNSAPTASSSLAAARIDMMVSTNEAPSRYNIDWKPRDYLDLSYADIGLTNTPVWIKFFSSVVDTGTSATTTFDVMLTGTLAFTFRGYK
jgi:hypothetical protein